MRNIDGAKAPLSNAQRQKAFRDSNRLQSKKELRGIYVTDQQENAIREFYKKLISDKKAV